MNNCFIACRPFPGAKEEKAYLGNYFPRDILFLGTYKSQTGMESASHMVTPRENGGREERKEREKGRGESEETLNSLFCILYN